MAKSKILSIEKLPDWQSQFGLMHQYRLTLASGEAGVLSTKKALEQQSEVAVGKEIEYDYTGGSFPKIKLIRNNPGSFGGGRGGDPRSEKGMNRRTALMQSVEHLKGLGDSKPSAVVLRMADEFFSWLEKDV